MKNLALLALFLLVISFSAISQPEIIVQAKHNSKVLQSKYSSDGEWLATSDNDGKIIIWDSKTKKRVRSFDNKGYPAKALAFHPNKNILISSSNNRIIEWNIYNGKIVRILKAEHDDYITSLDFSNDGKYLVSGSIDESAIVWRFSNGKMKKRLKQNLFYNNAIYSVKFSKFGEYVFTAGEDINVNMWDWRKNELIRKFKHHKYKINNIAINSTSSLIASASNDSKINIWNINSGKKIATLQLPNSDAPAQNIAFHPTLDRIIATYYKNYTDSTRLYTKEVVEGKLIMWDINKSKIVWDKDLLGGVLDIDISSDKKSFITANSDSNIKIFNISNGQQTYTLGSETQINSIVFVPERNEFITALNNGIIKIWDSNKLKIKGILETNIPQAVSAIDYDYASGNLVAAIGSTIFIWNYDYNEKKYLFSNTFKISESDITEIKLTDLSSKIFIKRKLSYNKFDIDKLPAYKNGIIPEDLIDNVDSIIAEVYNLKGDMLFTYDDILHENIHFANNNSNLKIAFTSSENDIIESDFNSDMTNSNYIYKEENIMNTNSLIESLASNASKLSSSASNYKGFVQTHDKTAVKNAENSKVLKLEQKRLSKINPAFTINNKYKYIDYSANGEYLAACGLFDYIELYDLIKKQKKEIGRFSEAVEFFSFSSDNTMLATISGKKIQVWNVLNGALENEISSKNILKEVHFFDQNKKLLSYGHDDGIKIWNTEDLEPIATIISVGKSDYITLSDESYYVSSENGSQGVAFYVNETCIPVECFKMKYSRPEIIMSKLGSSDNNIIADYSNEYTANLEKFGITKDEFDLSHIPTVEIQNKSEFKWFTNNRLISLDLRATDLSYDLKRINIYVNGVPILKPNQIDISHNKTDNYTQKYTIELNMGKNVIYAYTTNEKGAESVKDSLIITLKLRNDAEEPKPDLYIIALGTYQFAEKELNSEFTLESTRKLIQILGKDKSNYRNIIIDTLFNEEALKYQLLSLKRKYRHVKVDDQFIVISSGYSVLKNNFDVYFATHNMNFGDPEKNGIAHTLINSMLAEVPARNKIVIVDSWQFIQNETAKNLDKQTNKELSEITFGSYDPAKNIRKDIFKEMYKTSGTTVLFTNGINKTDQKVNLITKTLAHGYRKKNADFNNDGIISSHEINNYFDYQHTLIEESETEKKVAVYKEF